MYSTSVSRPTRSPTWAKTVLTELVSASVKLIGPKLCPPAFSSGTPLMVLGEDPSITVVGVTLPLSSAAVAVTALKVEPGGYSSCVVRFRSGWVGAGSILRDADGTPVAAYSGIDT